MKKKNHFPITLHNNVMKFRKSKGLSQAVLAQRAKISRGNLFKIEHNQVILSVLTALLIAKTLSLSVQELFSFEKITVLSEEQKFDLQLASIINGSKKITS